jgi:hypothetical protein
LLTGSDTSTAFSQIRYIRDSELLRSNRAVRPRSTSTGTQLREADDERRSYADAY